MSENPKRKEPRKRVVANREGRVYQRSSDDRWVGAVYPPDDMGGKVRYVYGRSRAEAKAKKADLERDLAAGLPVGKDQPVAEFFSKWISGTLAAQVTAGHIEASTADSYADNVRLHIIPELGSIPMRKLTVSRVRQWQADLLAKPSGRPRRKLREGENQIPLASPLSRRTVAYCHAILRRALNDAMRDEIVARNVAALVSPPRAPKGERKRRREALTKEQTEQLLGACSSDPLWCYWLTLLTLGLRRGEGLGLLWGDVNFDAKTVRLRFSIQRVRGKLVAKNLKSEDSYATLPVGDGILEALRTHQREQRARRMRSEVWVSADLVFTTSIGTAIEPRNVGRSWEAICERAGVKAVVHDLRHACGTYLAAAGVHPKAIQATLRHGRMATTEIYVHALEETSREAAEKMDAIVTDLRSRARRSS